MTLQDTVKLNEDNFGNTEVVLIFLTQSEQKDLTTVTPSDNFSLLDLVPPASIIVILIFLFDRVFGHWSGRRAGRRTWYMDIIIKPNTSKVDALYRSISDKVDSTKRLLERMNPKPSDHIKIVTKASKEIGTEVNKFVHEVIYLVRAHDPDLEDKLFLKIIENQDIISNGFDPSIPVVDIDTSGMKSKVLNNKAEFYSIMYATIRWKSIPRSIWDSIIKLTKSGLNFLYYLWLQLRSGFEHLSLKLKKS